jgi:hypothetical protein
MENTKSPRSARRKRPSHFREVSVFLRRHESTIAALSVFISSVGLLIAAVSTWTAWQEVRIISLDRQTPFRAVLFDQQVSSMNAALEDMARFQSATICAESIILNEQLGNDREARRACIARVGEAMDRLELSIKRSIALWPKESNAALRKYLVESARQNACLSQILLLHQNKFQNGEQTIACTSDFGRERDWLLDLEMTARKAMDTDLRRTSAIDD